MSIDSDALAQRIARSLVEQTDMVERIAQAVVQRIGEREQINRLADMVVEEIARSYGPVAETGEDDTEPQAPSEA